MSEEIFLMLKPDAIRRGLIEKIISKLEKESGSIMEKCIFTEIKKEKIEEWYDQKDKISKKSYPPKKFIVKYLSSGPIILMLWRGENALKKMRKIVGNSTNPPDSEINTIRREFGIDTIEKASKEKRVVENLVHLSRTKQSAEREIAFWFRE